MGVTVWDLRSDRPAVYDRSWDGAITSLSFAPDATALAVHHFRVKLFGEPVRAPELCGLWHPKQKGPFADSHYSYELGGSRSVFIDDKTLAVYYPELDGVKLWDISASTGAEDAPFPAKKCADPDFSDPKYRPFFAWNPYGLATTTVNDRPAIGLNVRTPVGKLAWTWPIPGRVYRAAIAPDNRHALTVNGDGTIYIVRLWDPTAAAADRLLRSCDQVLKRDPKNVDALVARGHARLAKKRYADARADADAALTIDRAHAGAIRLRAAVLYHMGLQCADEGRYAEAREHLAEALRLDPTLATAPTVDRADK
jgi:hypothetical protein